jgi:hypothetical protein
MGHEPKVRCAVTTGDPQTTQKFPWTHEPGGAGKVWCSNADPDNRVAPWPGLVSPGRRPNGPHTTVEVLLGYPALVDVKFPNPLNSSIVKTLLEYEPVHALEACRAKLPKPKGSVQVTLKVEP